MANQVNDDGSYSASVQRVKTRDDTQKDLFPVTDTQVQDSIQLILNNRRASRFDVDKVSTIRDYSWIRQSFAVPFTSKDSGDSIVSTIDLSEQDIKNSTYSTAIYKFNNTSLGGGYAINPRPQFSPYTDPRALNVFQQPTEDFPDQDVSPETSVSNPIKGGMGIYYSEAYDDTQQVIHMRFGTPQFNSMATFFAGFYNAGMGSAARSGRFAYDFSQTIGTVVGLVVTVLYTPLLVMNILGTAYRFFAQKPSSRYYYLKPTMLVYWLTVTNMVNQIAVNRGLTAKVPWIPDSANPNLDTASSKVNGAYQFDKEAMDNIHRLLPDIFSADGGIDVVSIASKAQRLKNQFDKRMAIAMAEGNITDFPGFVKEGRAVNNAVATSFSSIITMLETWIATDYGSKTSDSQGSDGEIDLKNIPQTDNSTAAQTSDANSTANYFDAEFNDGLAFANFRVEYTGPVSENFSSSVVESDIQQKFNSTSSQARSARFSLADGNLVEGMGVVKDMVTGFLSGAMDALNISGLMALGGSAFVDIPKHWDSSSASLPKANYTMTLISPSGNPLSQMVNIYVPLCMLLAAALPLSTGRQSWTSPFLCELYDRGRCQTRLGIIDSLSITRGTSNLGFNKEGNAMAIQVSFSVVDLSSVVSIPISQKFVQKLLNPLDGIFDDENAYSDYMAILSSQTLNQQIYSFNKFKLRLMQKIRSYENIASPAVMAAFVHEYTPVGMLDILFKGTQMK